MRCMVLAIIRRSGLIAATLCNTMCVYIEEEAEQLTGTLWRSDEVPLGPLGVTVMTLEFFSNGDVELNLEMEETQEKVIGHYDQDGVTATFSDVKSTIKQVNITFIEAHLNANHTLFLLWCVEDILYPFTTALHAGSSLP